MKIILEYADRKFEVRNSRTGELINEDKSSWQSIFKDYTKEIREMFGVSIKYLKINMGRYETTYDSGLNKLLREEAKKKREKLKEKTECPLCLLESRR